MYAGGTFSCCISAGLHNNAFSTNFWKSLCMYGLVKCCTCTHTCPHLVIPFSMDLLRSVVEATWLSGWACKGAVLGMVALPAARQGTAQVTCCILISPPPHSRRCVTEKNISIKILFSFSKETFIKSEDFMKYLPTK